MASNSFEREDSSTFDAHAPLSAVTIYMSSHTQVSEEQFMLMEVIIQKLQPVWLKDYKWAGMWLK